MEISQGNLYYHFHNKEEIVNALFCEFEQQMDRLLEAVSTRPMSQKISGSFST